MYALFNFLYNLELARTTRDFLSESAISTLFHKT